MLSLRTGESVAPLKKYARQEEWVLYVYSAKALGMALDRLVSMKEPDRTFWFYRGLMLNRAEAEAMEEDALDRELTNWTRSGKGGI